MCVYCELYVTVLVGPECYGVDMLWYVCGLYVMYNVCCYVVLRTYDVYRLAYCMVGVLILFNVCVVLCWFVWLCGMIIVVKCCVCGWIVRAMYDMLVQVNTFKCMSLRLMCDSCICGCGC